MAVQFERAWQGSGRDWLRATPAWVDPVIRWANRGFANAKQYEGNDYGFNFNQEQDRLRSILELMAQGNSPRRELREAFGELQIAATATINARGEITTTATANFESLTQWYATALAALIHDGIGDRVKRCPYVARRDNQRCRNFFVDWPGRGRPQEYCCTQHENNASKQRNRKGESQ